MAKKVSTTQAMKTSVDMGARMQSLRDAKTKKANRRLEGKIKPRKVKVKKVKATKADRDAMNPFRSQQRQDESRLAKVQKSKLGGSKIIGTARTNTGVADSGFDTSEGKKLAKNRTALEEIKRTKVQKSRDKAKTKIAIVRDMNARSGKGINVGDLRQSVSPMTPMKPI